MERIFDPIRKKYVALTEEENVRQQIILMLKDLFHYPYTHMASEYSFKFNSLNYRADIVVFNRNLKATMLIECKAPSVKLTEEVISQVIRYNYVLNVKYILITNGANSHLFMWDKASDNYIQSDHFPNFEELCKDDTLPRQ